MIALGLFHFQVIHLIIDFKHIVLFCSLQAVSTAVHNAFTEDMKLTRYEDKSDDMNIHNLPTTYEHLESNKMLGDLLARVEQLEAREKAREKIYLKDIKNLRRQLVIQTGRTTSLERQVRRLIDGSIGNDKQAAEKQGKTSNVNAGRTNEELTNRKHQQRIRRTMNETPVAFFATLSQHLEHVGAHQAIAFDHVVTNIGNAYNSHFGSFVAPVSGTYVFSATLFCKYHTNYHAQFARNGQPITTMYMYGAESGHATTSQTIVLELQKGNDVSVQSSDVDRSVFGYNYSTFAGFLLQEDYSTSTIVGK
ncbi:uncharacterized protein LOC123562235 [Mercenaria mercenaria]|uniref:uncharacterized protein LOC123562235 n=1 Tax=Mercenaria mercenaria TaxID=6596 RepID=UPI00234F5BC5|nr:uncharacterized protein LOC123562235 [Mercenaria mercenaria]